ncbi:hypothetical protein FNO01nite_04840 [Flavobacterium noncentrifugens]|nr:hypothetical protein FNO01nite_04840 [Flavobacterium noncentrifugens]
MLQAQNQFKVPDSLKRKSYAYLSEKLDDDNSGRLADSLYVWSYLYKAKSEKNLAETAMGFKHLMYHSPKNFRLIYADSMVETASKTKDALIIGSAYLSRGIIFYGQNRYNDALNDYITANEYLSKTKDKYQIFKAKYNLGLMKYFLKYTDEAYSLFKECTQYYETNGGKPYLHSLHMVALCYQSMEKFERSTATNTLGIAEALQTGDHDIICYFEHCQGVNDYLTGNYDTSIRLLEKSMPGILKNEDGANAAVGYFYLGKDYLSKNDMGKALPYLKKIDSISRHGTYIRNDLWESYDILVAYYESIHDEASKSYYSQALTKATRANHSDYESVSGKMAYDYTKKIQQSESEKAAIAKSGNNKIIAEAGIIILLAIGLVSVSYKFKKQKQIDQKRFRDIFHEAEETKSGSVKMKVEIQPSDGLSDEVREKILDALDGFENGKGFRDKQTGLPELSRLCHSNTKYVSKAINVYKNKSVPDYLDSLRIEYVHKKLREDRQYANTKIAAISEDAGFKTPQKFNQAFKKYTKGLSPGFFMAEIRKSREQA